MADFDLSAVMRFDGSQAAEGAGEVAESLEGIGKAQTDVATSSKAVETASEGAAEGLENVGKAATSAAAGSKSLFDRQNDIFNAMGKSAKAATEQAAATAGVGNAAETTAAAITKASLASGALAVAEQRAELAASNLAKAQAAMAAAAKGSAADQARAADQLAAAQLRVASAELGVERALKATQPTLDGHKNSLGGSRIAAGEAEHSIRAFTDSIIAGQNPIRAFSLELPRLAQAATFAGDGLGKVGTFLSGPWGIAFTIGISVVAGLVSALLDGEDAAGKEGKAFGSLVDATKKLDDATGRLTKTKGEEIAYSVAAERQALKEAIAKRGLLATTLAGLKATAQTPQGGTVPGGVQAVAAAGVGITESAIADNEKAIGDARSALRDADFTTVLSGIKAATDKVTAANQAYEASERRLRKAYDDGKISREALNQGLLEATNRQKAATAAAREGRASTAGQIDDDARLAAAHTAVDRAEAKLAETRRSAKADLESGKITQAEATAEITRGIEAVNQAKAAQKNATAATRAQAKATREAAEEEKRREATLERLREQFEKTTGSAAKYQKTISDIQALFAAGKIGIGEEVELGYAASQANRKEQAQSASETATTVFDQGVSGSFKEEVADVLKQADASFHSGIVNGSKDGADQLRQGITDAFKTVGSDIGSLFSGKTGSAVSAGIGSLSGLFGQDPAQQKRDADFGDAVSKISKGIGISDDAATSIGKNAGKAFGGAAAGEAANQIFEPIAKSIGLKTSKTGAEIGGAAGALSGIPGGQEIGAIVGSIIGGLFKTTKKGSVTLGNVDGSAAITSTSGNSASRIAAATTTGGAVNDALDTILQQVGGTLGNFAVSIGMRDKKYVVDSSGTGRTKGGTTTKYGSAEEAEAAALADAIRDGAVQGVSAAVQAALQQNASDPNKAVSEALKVKAVEVAIGGIGAQLKATFDTFDTQAADSVAIAKKYGLDVLAVEKANADARTKLVSDTLKASVGSLQDFLTSLSSGDLFEGSAADKRSAILGQIATAKGQADQGVDGAADTLATLYQNLLSTSKDAYGTAGDAYSSDRDLAQSGAQSVIQSETDRINTAAGLQQATTAAVNTVADNTSETNDLLAQIMAQLKQNGATSAVIPAGGGGGGASLTSRNTQLV
jgi:hypothetical protein